jgi:hypothetical protein
VVDLYPIAKITPGTYYRRDVGKLRVLQNSIRDEGLLYPVPILPDGTLLAGGRRLQACKNLGVESIPVVIAYNDREAVELLCADYARGPHVQEMTASETVAYGLWVESFESSRSTAERKAAGFAQIRDFGAYAVGMHAPTYATIRPIAIAAQGQDMVRGSRIRYPATPELQEYSQKALLLVDRVVAGERIAVPGRRLGMTLSSIQEEWYAAREDLKPATVPDIPDTAPRPAKGQRTAITTAMQNLSGLCQGLALVGTIDPATTPEEVAAWLREINRAETTLRLLRVKMKEFQK